jgi:hypothetical protein
MMRGSLRLHFTPDLEQVISMGVSEIAASSLFFLMTPTEYLGHVSWVNSKDEKFFDTLRAQVRAIRDSVSQGNAIFPSPAHADAPTLDIHCDTNENFDEAKVAIASKPGIGKEKTDKMIATAAPMLLYMLCVQSNAGFDKALEVTIKGIVDYTTIYEGKPS